MIVSNMLKNNQITIEELKEKYGLDIKEYSDRYIFNYNQIDSYKYRFDPIVCECRALILDKDYNILHRSFDRFFNYNEDPNTTNFNIQNAICDEKLDGTLIGIYFDNSKWCISTRKMAFAEGEIKTKLNFKNINTFNELINYYFKNELDIFYKHANINYSYIFEFVSPDNRIVTVYNEPRLVLLAVRNKLSGEYLDRKEEGKKVFWKWYPKEYKFQSFTDIIDTLSKLPSDYEGYVCNLNNWRIKIKNPAYLAIHNLRTNNELNENAIIHLVHNMEYDEYLSYYPEDKEYFNPYINIYLNMFNYLDNEYDKYKNIETQKDFALSIIKHPFKHILFKMREKNIDSKNVIYNEIKLDSAIINLYKSFYKLNLFK